MKQLYPFCRKLLEHRNRINLEVEANQPIQPRRPAPTRPPEKDKDEKKKDKDGKKKESTKRRPAPAVPTTSASTQDSAVKGLEIFDQTINSSVCLLYIFEQ